MKRTRVRVDYYYLKNGSRTRTQTTLHVVYNLNQGTTDFAVMNYLRKRHPGCEIELLSTDWE